jgi:hypothetical protein
MLGVLWVAAQVAASREGLSSMDLAATYLLLTGNATISLAKNGHDYIIACVMAELSSH